VRLASLVFSSFKDETASRLYEGGLTCSFSFFTVVLSSVPDRPTSTASRCGCDRGLFCLTNLASRASWMFGRRRHIHYTHLRCQCKVYCVVDKAVLRRLQILHLESRGHPKSMASSISLHVSTWSEEVVLPVSHLLDFSSRVSSRVLFITLSARKTHRVGSFLLPIDWACSSLRGGNQCRAEQCSAYL
jgi:hypothetical protein